MICDTGQQIDVPRRVELHRLQIDLFDGPQHGQQDRAVARRRAGLDNQIAPCGDHRQLGTDVIGREILAGDQGAVRGEIRAHLTRDIASIEGPSPAGGDASQRAAHGLLLQPVADRWDRSPRHVERRSAGVVGKLLADIGVARPALSLEGVVGRQIRVEIEAFLCERRGRVDEIGP